MPIVSLCINTITRQSCIKFVQFALKQLYNKQNQTVRSSRIKTFLPVSSADDSPVKITNNRKRLRIHSSDSENELENNATKDKESKKKSCHKVLPSKEINKLKENLSKASIKKNENKVDNERGGEAKEVPTPDEKNCEYKSESLGSTLEIKKVEEYDPAKLKYHPIKDACWKQGEKVPYYALAKTFEQIEKESARLKMMEIYSNYVRSVLVLSPEDLLPSIFLTLNRVGPSSCGLELGIAEQTLIRAISQTTGRTAGQIKNDIQEVGDIGLIAEKSKAAQKLMFKPAPLTVNVIFKKFVEIAKMTGKTTVNKKLSIIENLLVACQGPEAKYLIRSLNGKLRIGLAEQTLLQALALACAKTPPGQSYPPKEINMASSMSPESFKSLFDEYALTLKTTYCECPNYDLVIPVLLKEGIPALPKHCKVTPGLSMKPMLAQPTKGVQEVLSRFDGIEFTCEFKYDGERAQIHCCENGEVKIFSRNQEDFTSRYPDIISRINQVKKDCVSSFILDCEAVAWDKESSELLPFQVLTTRKRKGVVEAEIKVPVCVFMFDLLYLNGESLVKEKFFDRRRLLHQNFNESKGEWMFPSYLDSSTMEEVQEFLEQSVKSKCEGLMVKTLKEDATYEIAKRSRNWLKLKKDYLEGVGDTLDLVPLGGYFGKGKRTGTYGGFLVGCYDAENEEYQTICKLGSGFTEECLASQTEFFKKHIVSKAPSYYQHDSSLEPDQWFEPVQVWEIKCADLSLSPIYRAAIGAVDPGKGISLRFPRFVRVREDKKPEEATTSEQVMDLYCNQEQIKAQLGKSAKFQEEDFY